MFCWSSISKRDEIMSSFRQMHRIKEIRVDMPVPTSFLSSYFFGCFFLIYLCNTNCLEPGQDQWIPKALLILYLEENVCSGYSLGAALSNVNDSFTLSRLMKQHKHVVIRHVMSTHNLRFFVKYT